MTIKFYTLPNPDFLIFLPGFVDSSEACSMWSESDGEIYDNGCSELVADLLGEEFKNVLFTIIELFLKYKLFSFKLNSSELNFIFDIQY